MARGGWLAGVLVVACVDARGSSGSGGDGTSTTGPEHTGSSTGSSSTSEEGGSSTADSVVHDLAPGFDVAAPTDQCRPRVGHRVDPCTDVAPPDSFDPEVQWSWAGAGADVYSGVTPLVANLTDDNGDDSIDLCDTPDVLVIATSAEAVNGDVGRLYVLDGATGKPHAFPVIDIAAYATPAIGDVDDDGRPDIVAVTTEYGLVALEADGTPKWTWSGASLPSRGSVAIANVDNVGLPEVIAGSHVIGGDGVDVFGAEIEWTFAYAAPTAADLDGDGDLELVVGNTAYHHDGGVLWSLDALHPSAFPQVADFDGDPEPEVLLVGSAGVTIVQHDGTLDPSLTEQRPTGDANDHVFSWLRPAAADDFDTDPGAEFVLSSRIHYSVFDMAPVAVLWSAAVEDISGAAGGSAFDFLGDGMPDAMYADEVNLFVFDEQGSPLFAVPHASRTFVEYPIVADVDNDGSAEIVVVSNEGIDLAGGHPTVQVIRDREDRWVPARRIWNQHTYHVSNVEEDGSIPPFEPPHWQALNTFRTQAQIADGTTCDPAG